MAKSNSNVATTEAPAAVPSATENHVITYRNKHPQNRVSYGVQGNTGVIVFDKNLFDPSVLDADGNPPEAITVSVLMKMPKADARAEREAANAAKVIERAQKAQEKLAASQAKAAEKQKKADEALAAAKAKVEAANAAKAAAEAAVAAPAPQA